MVKMTSASSHLRALRLQIHYLVKNSVTQNTSTGISSEVLYIRIEPMYISVKEQAHTTIESYFLFVMCDNFEYK